MTNSTNSPDTNTIAAPPSTNSSTAAPSSILYWGLDGGGWDTLVLVSLAVGVIAAIFIFMATGGATEVHKREARASQEALDRYKQDAGKQIAASNATAEGAKADVADAAIKLKAADLKIAELETAGAQARAAIAESNARTAQAQLDLRRLQFSFNRTVDVEALKTDLGAPPSGVTVEIYFDEDTRDTLGVATQLAAAFEQANWRLSPSAPKPLPPMPDNAPAWAARVGRRLVLGAANPGIAVAFPSEQRAALEPIAERIAVALGKATQPSQQTSWQANEYVLPNTLRVFVLAASH